jgi:hypothetical protein
MTFAELRDIVKARQNNWRIKPGERYNKSILVMDGYLSTWRAIPAIEEICFKYNLIECDC